MGGLSVNHEKNQKNTFVEEYESQEDGFSFQQYSKAF